MNNNMFLASVFSLLALTAAEAAVKMKQEVSLKEGWNAVYLRVGPEDTADVLFANWPVKWVALYDPAAFGDTRQFDQKSETEGTAKAGYLIWRRGDKGASTFATVPANSVLVTFATNAMSATSVYGAPQAPRITWHDSQACGTLNLVGFSVDSDTVTDAYFSGLDVGDAPFYVFGGGNNPEWPSILPVTMVGKRHFVDGEVLLVDSKKTSDWSGVLRVSPANGLDFGTDYNKSALEVRNDGCEARDVEMTVRCGDVPTGGGGEAHVVPTFYYRDGLDAVVDGPWTALGEGEPVVRSLSTGETWRIDLAIDRSKLTAASGTVYGAIFEFRDVSESFVNEKNVLVGGSHMKAFVPVSVTGNGEARAQTWQRGLWLVSAELNKVTHLDGENNFDVTAGGKMKVRLPVYINENGKMHLLQRFWYGRDTNGVLKVFSGAVTSAGEPISGMKRLSSPFLPTDQPVIDFDVTSSLTNSATVNFTVKESSKVNPMYHARHPQHDGLTADFSGDTPSGDILKNYNEGVKPELFSITNTIEFVWDRTNAAWEPEETSTGSLTWRFNGLRHGERNLPDGELRAKGSFTMKHLTSASVKLKQ